MATKRPPARLFEVTPCGDPFNRRGYDVREYCDSYDEPTCTYRGDLSPSRGLRRTVEMLRRLYPGCRVRVSR